MNEQQITLTVSLVNGILQYLGTRPDGEIFQLIKAIQEQAAPQVASEPPTQEEQE